jgi:hypothetical protein
VPHLEKEPPFADEVEEIHQSDEIYHDDIDICEEKSAV